MNAKVPHRARKHRLTGDFRYKSTSIGKVVTSPFSIIIKVQNGKVTYVQFLEDTYATAASFRTKGTWTVHTQSGGTDAVRMSTTGEFA